MIREMIAAAALFGLAACLENPGVDQGLATKHDRISARTDLKGGNSIRMRLERDAGRTRLYIANLGGSKIDSLSFFFQAARYETPVFDADYWKYPVFTVDPVAEYRGDIHGLAAGKEADLGPIPGDFPGEMDRLSLLLIPLSGSIGGNRVGTEEGGYFEGRFQGRNENGTPASGTARGLVSATGAFWFWLLDDAARRIRSLSGETYRDTLETIHMDGSSWHRADSAGAPKVLFHPPGAPDSIRFEIPFAYAIPSLQDSSITFGFALSRRPLVRWDPPVTSGIVIWEPSR